MAVVSSKIDEHAASETSTSSVETVRASYEALIRELGSTRDEQRAREQQQEVMNAALASKRCTAKSFLADLVLREDETGFELWLGSLEDALSLRALREHGISAFLNCALDDCQAECACFRPTRWMRPRCHTRNHSIEDSSGGHGWDGLQRDQIWTLANFDADWYSDVLEWDVYYFGLSARDQDGYKMNDHFPKIIDFLSQCRRDGLKVLVHCVMGINRSAAAVAAFLAGGMGMPLKASLELLAERRGCVLSNKSFLDQLIVTFNDQEVDPTKTTSTPADVC